VFCFALLRLDWIAAAIPAVTSAAAVAVSLTIILDCIMTFFGSSANDAAFNAWLTDSTDDTNRGGAEGINSMMPLVAILVVFGGFMAFDLDKAESWTAIYLIIGITVVVIGLLGLVLLQESGVRREENRSVWRNILYGFRPSVMRENPVLYATLVCFAVFGISIQIFMPYLILYYNVSLGMENYVLIMAPAILIAAAVTAVYGRTYDKWGFRRSVLPAVAMLCAGYVLLYFFRGTALVFIGSLLMMCGYLAGAAVFGAVIRDNTPENRAGMFQGLRIFGQVLIPGMIGPAIGAKILENAEKIVGDDGTEAFVPNANIFLAALIAALALSVLLAAVFAITERKERK